MQARGIVRHVDSLGRVTRCKEELPPEAARTIVDEHEGDRSFIAWRFEVKGRPVPYVRMTQAEVLMAKRGLGSRGRQINRYYLKMAVNADEHRPWEHLDTCGLNLKRT